MLRRVSDNPNVCQITNIQIISNLLNYESNVRCPGTIVSETTV